MFQPDEKLVKKIDQWIEENTDAFVRDLDRLVAVPSIARTGEGKYPFGEDCAKVLDVATEIAAEYGFIVENHEYYCEPSGEGNKRRGQTDGVVCPFGRGSFGGGLAISAPYLHQEGRVFNRAWSGG